MSNARHPRARLLGYVGPVYTAGSDALGAQLDKSGSGNSHWLRAATSEVEGRSGEFTRPLTSDSYDWFWAIPFTVPTGGVLVAIPWSQDWDKTDGTQRDRAVAVYTKGDVAPDDIEQLLTNLTEAIRKQQEVDAQQEQPA